jgi:hypothetical protein
LLFSGTPPPPVPPAPGLPMADMVRLRSSEVEEREELECAFNPERPQHLKKSDAGEGAGIVGSVVPDASATVPLILCHACAREGNRCGRHKGSWVRNQWDAPLTRAMRHLGERNHYGCRRSLHDCKQRDITLQHTHADGSIGPDFERHEFRGAGRWLTAAEQLPAGSVRGSARPEIGDRTPRDLTSRPKTFQPDEDPWDFDGRKLTSARNRTRRSHMLSHETLPVLGASVVGMTI